MDLKKVILTGLLGGVWLFLAMFIFGWFANLLAPYSILDLPGMRSEHDLLMVFFFLYPFVLSLMAAIVYGMVKESLQKFCSNPGLCYGMILILLLTIPNLFLLYTSMEYPHGFYLSLILEGVLGYPVLGLIYGKIWNHS